SQVSVIVTSRERLKLHGEAVYTLEGLAIPPDNDDFDPEAFSATKLFIQTARRVNPSLEISVTTLPYLRKICMLVDGMPLGIELAAAWSRFLSWSEIAVEIERNMDFLTTEDRDIPLTHKSLRTVFETSWKMLPEKEKNYLSCLAVFEGGFTRDAAQQVTGTSLKELSALIDKSILHRVGNERYFILNVLHQYVRERFLQDQIVSKKIKQNHSRYFIEFLVNGLENFRREQDPEFMSIVKEDMGNIRKGWIYSVELHDYDQVDVYGEELSFYFDRTGLYREGSQITQTVLDLLENNYQPAMANETAFKKTQAGLSYLKGSFEFGLGNYELSGNYFQKSLELFSRIQKESEIANALNGLGGVESRIGNYAKAKDYYERSLKIRTKINNKKGIASSLNNLANIVGSMGETEKANEYYQKSLSLLREIGDKRALATLLANVGISLGNTGDRKKERELLNESYQIRKEIGDKTGLAFSLENLGNAELALGNIDSAQKMLQESLEIREELGDKWGIAHSMLNLANLYKYNGDNDRRAIFLHKALKLFKNIGDRFGVALTLCHLGGLMATIHSPDQSERFLKESYTIFQEMGDQYGMLFSNINLGFCYIAAERYKESLSIFCNALKYAQNLHLPKFVFKCFSGLVAVLIEYPPDPDMAVTISDYLLNTDTLNLKEKNHVREKVSDLLKRYPDFAGKASQKDRLPRNSVDKLLEEILKKYGDLTNEN
ncbi:tetratricopeptide repeat protein, partial [bacterium]|nr:tetratricopeptide repeat protein [candidate division CSSED10-310 bacterium]